MLHSFLYTRILSTILRMNRTRVLFGSIFMALAALGLWASFALTLDKLTTLQNPDVELTCSVNEAINCSSVMKSWQAELLGFPNQLAGLVGYALFFAFGFFTTTTKKFTTRWVTILLLVGSGGAFIFSYWLLYHSIFVIESLCPWCLLSAFAATIIFFTAVVFGLFGGELSLSTKLEERIQTSDAKVLLACGAVLWFVFVVGMIFLQFGESLFY